MLVLNQSVDLADSGLMGIQENYSYFKQFKVSHGYLAFETPLSAYLTVVLHCVDVTGSRQAKK